MRRGAGGPGPPPAGPAPQAAPRPSPSPPPRRGNYPRALAVHRFPLQRPVTTDGVGPKLMFGFTPSGAPTRSGTAGRRPICLPVHLLLLAVRSCNLRRRTARALERIPAGMGAHSRHDCALMCCLRRWAFPAVRPRHSLPSSGPVVPPGIADPASLFPCGPCSAPPGLSGQKPGRRHNPRYFSALATEDILVDVLLPGHLRVLAGFLPEYHIHALRPSAPLRDSAARCALAAGILILLFSIR